MKQFSQWLLSALLSLGLATQVAATPLRAAAPAEAAKPQPAVEQQGQTPVGNNMIMFASAADAEAAVQPQPKGKLIYIDPGHGSSDVGAVHKGPDGQADLLERDVALDVAQQLADMLRREGYDVALTRTAENRPLPNGSQGADLQARVDMANKANADLLISVHFNGLDNKNTRGTEVWYCSDRPFSGDNERLATLVQESLVRNLRDAGYDTVDRGIKDDAKMGHFAVNGPHISRPSQMPGIIGEPLFMTNDEDAAQLKRPEVRTALAKGYFEGVKAYFESA